MVEPHSSVGICVGTVGILEIGLHEGYEAVGAGCCGVGEEVGVHAVVFVVLGSVLKGPYFMRTR